MTRRDGRRVPGVIVEPNTPAGRNYQRKNLAVGIKRRETRLQRSMAHIPHPRPADLERWRAMQAEIERMREVWVALAPPPRQPKAPKASPETGGPDDAQP